MKRTLHHVRTLGVAALLMFAGQLTIAPAASAAVTHPSGTRFYTPPPDPGAVRQIGQLLLARQPVKALQIGAMVATPQAVWFTKGTPQQVKNDVGQGHRARRVDPQRPDAGGLQRSGT